MSPLAWWHRTPLYLRILGAFGLGLALGLALGPKAAPLEIPAKLILRLLGALAPPLVLIAVIHALMQAEIKGRMGARMVFLLILNTLVAITIGLIVANVVGPGRHAHLAEPHDASATGPKANTWTAILDNVPTSVVKPLVDNQVIGVIFVAVAFGLALRRVREEQMRDGKTGYRGLEQAVEAAFRCLVIVLHWVVDIIPIGVLCIVASIVGAKGLAPFISLAWFVLSVMAALCLQATYYLLRVRLGSWVSPLHLLRGTRDALAMAFSTASSTATMPVTYTCLRENVGLREQSASMGALVGANFNNDGTALYEAMSALFVAQMLGMDMSLQHQIVIVLTSVVASVGAAGIPEAGLVTMTLVFTAVGLPTQYIAVLLTVDWFLDRCRTAINVMGDLNVSCLLDGKQPETQTAT
ncbi:MAG: dicarboxylate/amino acid:cation symporter [Chthonomonadales bacterium]|nr:dicarboxylate/amino acid:cation symporter [Chthonomonadales bacterium]